MSSTRWWDYIEPIIGEMTLRDAARKAGFNQSAFTRWKGGAKADPEFVVKFARAFDLNVLEALVAAEVITQDEAGQSDSPVDQDLREALRIVEMHGRELSAIANEMYRELERVKAATNSHDELAEKRSNKNPDNVGAHSYDGTVVDWDDTLPTPPTAPSTKTKND